MLSLTSFKNPINYLNQIQSDSKIRLIIRLNLIQVRFYLLKALYTIFIKLESFLRLYKNYQNLIQSHLKIN